MYFAFIRVRCLIKVWPQIPYSTFYMHIQYTYEYEPSLWTILGNSHWFKHRFYILFPHAFYQMGPVKYRKQLLTFQYHATLRHTIEAYICNEFIHNKILKKRMIINLGQFRSFQWYIVYFYSWFFGMIICQQILQNKLFLGSNPEVFERMNIRRVIWCSSNVHLVSCLYLRKRSATYLFNKSSEIYLTNDVRCYALWYRLKLCDYNLGNPFFFNALHVTCWQQMVNIRKNIFKKR